jgi:hypothetical protein
VVAAGGTLAAHRRDEYLQAARLAIEPDRLEIALDLTPGISVADQVLAGIDRDGSGAIDAVEGQAYAERVLRALTVDVDGTPLTPVLIDCVVPDIAAMREGNAALRLRAQARLPDIDAGVHRVRYRNDHRPDLGVYLANALAPASERVTIAAQHRDPEQRELTIDYSLAPGRAGRLRAGTSLAAAAVLIWFAARRRRRSL